MASKTFVKKLLLAFMILNHLVGCVAHHAGPEVLDNGVRFTLSAPTATSVAIAGSFNRWNPHQNLLSGPDQRGVWSALFFIPPGRHEYLFVINNEKWMPDPFAPSVSDGMGGENSVLIVDEPEP